jgi:hypothetical protein
MQQLKVFITGDFCPINRIEEEIINGNSNNIFKSLDKLVSNNDLTITNLECPLYEGNTPITKSGPNIKAKQETISGLQYLNFNLVTLANNHIFDHGKLGLESTLKLLKENKINYVGAGLNIEEASETFYFNKDGFKIAIINIAENEFGMSNEYGAGAHSLNLIQNFNKIQEAKQKADKVILIIHGGHEYFQYPSPRMVELYRFFIDAGVDVVVGHHTHCVSGYEKYNNGLIFYSLGNFIFDWKTEKKSTWYEGLALKLVINSDKIDFELFPLLQNKKEVGIRLMNEEEKIIFFSKINEINETITQPTILLEKWQEFIQTYEKWFICSFLPFNNNKMSALFDKLNLKLPYSKKNFVKQHNLVRCESHRDILLESLKNQYK